MRRTQYVWVKCRGKGCDEQLEVPQGLAISGDEPIAMCDDCEDDLDGTLGDPR